jgi:hypothetical protein
MLKCPDSCFVSLQIVPREFSGDGHDPADYFHKYKGTVRLTCMEDDSTYEIGMFAAIQIDLEGAWRAALTAHDVLDTTGPSFEFYEVLYTRHGYSRAALRAMQDNVPMSENLLILDRLLILPAFRGHQLDWKLSG